uniref:Transketolase N-terminal domain protein n=1 Tax=Streptomyces sp. SANK 60404 TaxID=1213862 RepID=A0A1B4ZDE4_9ACTN|nr:Transketolase N-terminal domain protein [Streptomyces sp. SANK 60404]
MSEVSEIQHAGTWHGGPPADHTLRVRELIVEMCGSAEGGHLGGSMSLVEVLVTLYRSVLRVDPDDPENPGRDVLLLSKGHGAIGLYAVLAERGFFPEERLATYGQPESLFSAHPNPAVPGVEMPTGSLGHGLPLGVGYALGARLDGSDRRCVVVMGDGELQEGSVWEAAMAAGSLGLGGLIAVVDRNSLQITGSTEDAVALEPLGDRWRSFGWTVHEVDGHDVDALRSVFDAIPADAGRPTVVIARTVKGRGLPYIEGQARSHYARLGERPKKRALATLRAQSRKANQA